MTAIPMKYFGQMARDAKFCSRRFCALQNWRSPLLLHLDCTNGKMNKTESPNLRCWKGQSVSELRNFDMAFGPVTQFCCAHRSMTRPPWLRPRSVEMPDLARIHVNSHCISLLFFGCTPMFIHKFMNVNSGC